MSSTADPQFTQQATWRPGRKAAGQMRRRKVVAVTALLACVALLIAAFLYLVTNPLRSPGTELVLLSASDPTGTAPLPFAHADFEAIQQNEPLFRRTEQEHPRIREAKALRTPADLQQLAAECDRQLNDDSDVLILYVRAYGTLVDGRPHLRWSFDRDWTRQRTLPLNQLLDMMSQRPCSTKLLVLDCGTESWHPEDGLLVNDFVRAAEDQLRARNDSSLWILTSRDDFQDAHYSRTLNQTVFGAVFADALSGLADHNADQSLTLTEIFRYVRSHTSEWVARQTARLLQQTPRLLHGSPIDWDHTPTLLTMARRYRPSESAEGQPAPDAPQGSDPPIENDAATPTVLRLPKRSVRFAAGLATILIPGPQDGAADSASSPPTPSAASAADSSEGKPQSAQGPPVESAAADSDSATAPTAPTADSASRSPSSEAAGAEPAATGGSSDSNGPWAAAIEAWQQRDRLNHTSLSPQQFAPHTWRLLQRSILQQQAALLFASDDGQQAAALELQRLAAGLKALPEPDPAAPTIVTTLARLLKPVAVTDVSQSLASLEFLHRLQLRELTSAETEALTELRTVLEAPDAGAARQWLQDRMTTHSEVRFLQTLLREQISWSEVVPLVRLRLTAEAAACSAALRPTWLLPALERAERLRLQAERHIRFPTGPTDADKIDRLVTDATRVYQEVQSAALELHAARQLVLRSLFDVPGHIQAERRRLVNQVHRTPDRRVLLRYLRSIARLLQALDPADELHPQQVHALQQLQTQVRADQRQLQRLRTSTIERLPASGPLSFVQELRVQRMLDSTLVDASARALLFQALDRTEPKPREPARRNSSFTEVIGPPRIYWDAVEQHARLELLRLQLMAQVLQISNASSLLTSAFSEAVQSSNAAVTSADRVAVWNSFADQLSTEHRRCAKLLEGLCADNRASFTSGDFLRSAATLALLNRQALSLLQLPDDFRILDVRSEVLQTSRRAVRIQRLLLARQDAPAAEQAELERQLAKLGHSPPAAGLQMQMPTIVQLSDAPSKRIPIVFVNHSDRLQQVYLSAEYDAAALQIRSTPGYHIFNAKDVQSEQAAKLSTAVQELNRLQFSTDPQVPFTPHQRTQQQQLRNAVQTGSYPPQPLRTGAKPTVELKPGEQRTVPLIVRLVRATSAAGRIIIRAQSPGVFLRRDLSLQTAAPHSVRPVVTGLAGTVSDDSEMAAAAGGTPSSVTHSIGMPRLQPFPNQTSVFRLGLQNLTAENLTASVTLLAAGAQPDIPPSPLTTAEADAWLADAEVTRELASAHDVVVTATDTPTMVTLAAPAPAGSTGAGDTEGDPTGSAVPGAAAARAPLPSGMILRVADTAADRVSLFRLPVVVQHPRRFIKTQASFDAVSSEFKVRVVGRDAVALPKAGVRLALNFDPPEESGSVRAVLDRSSSSVELTALVPSSGTESGLPRRVLLNVNDYPSAFAWLIPRTSVPLVGEDQTTNSIQILDPPPGTSQTSDVRTVTATLQIVASPGFPGSPGQKLQVGIDRDRDRELHDEPIVDLFGTRRVDVWWNGVSDSGELLLETRVGAMTVQIPVGDCRNLQANLLARIVDHDRTIWSTPVPITFDDQKPRVQRLTLEPAEVQAVGQPVRILATASDGELSGVDSVVVGVTTNGRDLVSEIPAVPLSVDSTGQWTGSFDTGPLAPGQHRLAVQVTDRAGNVSELTDRPILLVTPEEAQRMAAKVTNTVRGTITYGGQAVPGATVSVVPADPPKPAAAPTANDAAVSDGEPVVPDPVSTDEFGNYVLPGVRAGTYTLRATALVRGLNRQKSAPLDVKPPPARPRIDVDLR